MNVILVQTSLERNVVGPNVAQPKKVVSCYFALVVPADKLSSKVDILKCTKNIFNETVLSF